MLGVLLCNSMKGSTDVADGQSDISCMSIMDKFGLSSPTRAAAGVRYRPSATSPSPSHLRHLLRSHSNASSSASAAAEVSAGDMRAERREDGDGRSCESIATCAPGLTAVPDGATTTSAATTTAAAAAAAATTTRQQMTSHHHHHLHHAAAAESDDEDGDGLTDRRYRRLQRLNTTTSAPTATTTTTTTTATSDDDKCRETFHSADSRTVSTATVITPLLHLPQQQRRRRSEEDAEKLSAGVHSGVEISTQLSFSQVISSNSHLSLCLPLLEVVGAQCRLRGCKNRSAQFPGRML